MMTVKEAKVVIKRHLGVNLIGKYYKTDEQIKEDLENLIKHQETMIQAAKEMLEQKDFH